jgi:type III pantothenate kinase
MIGNSRLHWGYFDGNILKDNWHTSHLSSINDLRNILPKPLQFLIKQKVPLYIASVVPSQTEFYLNLPQTTLIMPNDIPLKGVYPTMGIDRSLALFGAGCVYGFPCLVIDGGTALTFTGANKKGELIGGAILPGINLQLQSLAMNTAALPVTNLTEILPSRWATNTPDAIKSGVIYTILAGIKNFIEDWLSQFPDSNIIITGGDAIFLQLYLQKQFQDIANQIILDLNLIFVGMRLLILERYSQHKN